MQQQKQKKRTQHTRDQFSDKQVYNQIKDDIKQIRQRKLKQVQQDLLINKLYDDKKKQMKLARIQSNQSQKPKQKQRQRDKQQLGEQEEQEGEIIKKAVENEIVEEGAPSINDLGNHIRPITITRSKMAELFKSRKFEQLVKGCFVRYKCQNSNNYLLGLVLGIVQGQKQYFLNNIKIKTLLKLQQSTTQIIRLSLDHISNQHPPGNLQISKWIQTNRSKIPKQKQLEDKLEQLNNLIHGKVSSSEIDQNLLKEASRVAHLTLNFQVATEGIAGVGNIAQLIYFMRNHTHDITVKIEEMDGLKDKEQQLISKRKEKKHCDQILAKLIEKQTQIKNFKLQKEKQDKKGKKKGYIDYIYNDRKEDKIRQIYHARYLQLCSFEGINKVREQIGRAHRNFDIDIDI